MECNIQNRFGDDANVFYPKSSRIFRVNELWYFYTREEGILGPFKNQYSAEEGVMDFLQDLLEKNKIHAA